MTFEFLFRKITKNDHTLQVCFCCKKIVLFVWKKHRQGNVWESRFIYIPLGVIGVEGQSTLPCSLREKCIGQLGTGNIYLKINRQEKNG